MVHNTVARHVLAEDQPSPEQQLATPSWLPQFIVTGHDLLGYGISLLPVWVTCPSPALPQLLVYLLTGRAWGTEMFLEFGVSIKQRLQHQCVISILIVSPKDSIVPAARKKINSLPAETRTVMLWMISYALTCLTIKKYLLREMAHIQESLFTSPLSMPHFPDCLKINFWVTYIAHVAELQKNILIFSETFCFHTSSCCFFDLVSLLKAIISADLKKKS